MVQKPPVDIEWYDDGFSIEEQAELRRQYTKQKAANRPKIQVTEEYHEKTKDKIISDLRQKLAANEEYIKELEEGKEIINKDLYYNTVKDLHLYKKKAEKLERRVKNYEAIESYLESLEAFKQFKEEVYNKPLNKLNEKIRDLEHTVDVLRDSRDQLIYKLSLCSQ